MHPRAPPIWFYLSSCLLCANPTTPLISMQAKAEEREEYLSELEGTCVALNEEVELANAHKARLAAEGENYAMQVLKNSHSLLPCLAGYFLGWIK